jgi:4-amino-4-deoxy-L-arabinose transferase-like glycosyltransferase
MTQQAAGEMNRKALWGLLVILGLSALLLAYRLAEWPAIWFDEGWHLQIAKNLALTGRYGAVSVEGFRFFDPAATTGPTVVAPVAAAFAAAGVNLAAARAVMVLYGLGAMACFYLVALRLFGTPTAIAASLLLLVMPGATQDTSGSFLALGRMVMGDVPALMFLLLGSLCWFRSVDRQSWLWAALAGVCFGFAAVTKAQAFIIFAVLGMVWIADRFWHRQLDWRHLFAPWIAGAAVVGIWWLIQKQGSGAAYLEQSGIGLQIANTGLVGLLHPKQMITSARTLLQEYVALLSLPGLVYGAYLAADRSRLGVKRFFIFAVGAIWLVWYLVGSIGWIRYALPALAVMGMFTAKLLADLSHNFSISHKALQIRSASDPEVLSAARDLAVTLALALVIFATLQEWLFDQASIQDTIARDFAAYLVETLPPDATIETTEPELPFLTDLTFHQPTLDVLSRAILHAQVGVPYPEGFYDFERYRPDYLVVGWMARGSNLYAEALAGENYELLRKMGGYSLYQRVGEADPGAGD